MEKRSEIKAMIQHMVLLMAESHSKLNRYLLAEEIFRQINKLSASYEEQIKNSPKQV